MQLFNKIDLDIPLEVTTIYNAEGGTAKKGLTQDRLVNTALKKATKNISIRGMLVKAL